MASNKAVTSPSTPSKNRAQHPASAVKDTVPKPRASRAASRVEAVEVIENPPTVAQVASLLNDPAIRQKHTAIPKEGAELVYERIQQRQRATANGKVPDSFTIDFLPDYPIDYRSDTQAARIPCGETTGIDAIEEEIRARFYEKHGPGAYRITPRLRGKLVGSPTVLLVKEPTVVLMSQPEREEELIEEEWEDETLDAKPFITPEQVGLRIQLARLEERLAGYERQAAQPSTQQAVPAKRSAIEQVMEEVMAQKLREALLSAPKAPEAAPLTPEVVIAKAIVENPAKFGAITERLMSKFLGDSGESENSSSWAAVLAPLVQQAAIHLPSFVQAIAMNSQAQHSASRAGQTVAHTPDGQTQPMTSDAAADAAIPPRQQTQLGQGDPMQQYQTLLAAVLAGLESNHDPQEAATRINAFLVLNPQFEEAVLNFAGMEIDQFLPTIGQIPGYGHLPALPHVREWLTKLQGILFKDEAEEAAAASAG